MMFKNLLKLRNIITLCTVIFASISFMGTASANFWSAILPTCTLTGKVVNQNQEPIEGVTVVFVSDGLGIQSRATTNSLGNYAINPPAQTSGAITVSKGEYRIITQQVRM